jgi:hypothetical protein
MSSLNKTSEQVSRFKYLECYRLLKNLLRKTELYTEVVTLKNVQEESLLNAVSKEKQQWYTAKKKKYSFTDSRFLKTDKERKRHTVVGTCMQIQD